MRRGAAACAWCRRRRPDRARRRQDLQEPPGGAERLGHVAPRRGGRPARPERRRQDHDLLHDRRPGAARHRLRSAWTAPTSPRLPMYRRARLGIGYLPQEASVFRGLNVEQNIMAALEVVEPDAATAATMMLDELLAEFGISHLRRTPALALSGGERRRVEIARALATQPVLHPARRAAGRHRPDRGRRNPRPGHAPEGPRHRRADHRPQRARDAGDHRPRLHHARRPGADGGPAGRSGGARRMCGGCTSGKGSACRMLP